MSDDIRINNDNSVLTVIRSAICWENETRKGKQEDRKEKEKEMGERERGREKGEKKIEWGKDEGMFPAW